MFVSILDFLTNRFTALTQKKKQQKKQQQKNNKKTKKKNTNDSNIKFKVKSQTF